jgi:hypothetical protein
MRLRLEDASVLLAGLLAALLLLASFAPSGVGKGVDVDDDTIDDDLEAETARAVVAVAVPAPFPNQIVVTSRSVGAEVDDAFDLTFEDGRFDLAYFREAGTETAAVGYRLEFRDLVEWRNGEEVGDAVDVRELLRRGTVRVNATRSISLDGENVTTFQIREVTGLFGVDLHVAERFAKWTPTLVLSPMEVKMDIFIEGYPFVAADTDLALEIRVRVLDGYDVSEAHPSRDVQEGYSGVDEREIVVSAGELATFFAWAETATVDGAERPVAVTDLRFEPEEGEWSLAFVYPQGQRIVHDPKLGVVSQAFEEIVTRPKEPTLTPDPFLFSLSLVVLAILVLAAVSLRRRRR